MHTHRFLIVLWVKLLVLCVLGRVGPGSDCDTVADRCERASLYGSILHARRRLDASSRSREVYL
jgi:hypothetical protein